MDQANWEELRYWDNMNWVKFFNWNIIYDGEKNKVIVFHLLVLWVYIKDWSTLYLCNVWVFSFENDNKLMCVVCSSWLLHSEISFTLIFFFMYSIKHFVLELYFLLTEIVFVCFKLIGVPNIHLRIHSGIISWCVIHSLFLDVWFLEGRWKLKLIFSFRKYPRLHLHHL